MDLFDLPAYAPARIERVHGHATEDPVARRLDELGFVPGEIVRVIGRGPVGREPVAVQVGHTRFALRRLEAQRVEVVLAARDEAGA
jgi:ferrous iron transport protein A